MGYEVVVEELRTAAGHDERTVADLAGYDVEAVDVAADAVGRVEPGKDAVEWVGGLF